MNINPWAAVQRLIDKALAGYCPYGIDDVYVTFSNTEPTARWPGTSWERITDCFLRAADESHPAGTTGGAWAHKMVPNELAAHYHCMPYNRVAGSPLVAFKKWSFAFADNSAVAAQITEDKTLVGMSSSYTGGNSPMNIENKYIAVNMWRRTA